MDLAFEQLLAEHNQEFKEAEVYSSWMPDDGEYIASVTKLAKGSSSKDGKNSIWWRLTGRIEDVQDEQNNGREFSVGYFTSKAYGILKGAARVLSGNPNLDDLKEAHAILEASLGLVLRVKISTSVSKKDGKKYTNCYILEVINTTPEASAEETHLPEEATYVDPTNVPAPIDDGNVAVANAPVEVPAEAPPVV